MRLAVISDIHSNLHALNAVIEAIQGTEVDLVVCAGDIVGYGAFPNECCRILKNLSNHVVFGNHDIAALTEDTTWMNPDAAKAALWTARNLSTRSRHYLESLKIETSLESDKMKTRIFHGSPRSVAEYVYEEDAGEGMLDAEEVDLLVLGHTHVPFVKSFGDRLIVNPGSVGQPRDHDSRASWALIDTKSKTCSIQRVSYDIGSAAEAIDAAGLPGFLAARLFSGM